MDLSLLTLPRAKVNDIPSNVDGRFVTISDHSGFFYEMNGKRYKVNTLEYISNSDNISQDTPGVTETVYFNNDTRMLYAFNTETGLLEPVQVPNDVVKFNVPDINVTFADATWEQIKTIAELGLGPKLFKIGESKHITDSKGVSWIIQIVGFDHDDRTDGQGKANITFRAVAVNYLDSWSLFYDSWTYTTLGYLGSKLESSIASYSNNIFTKLGITEAIKPVNKLTYNTRTGDVLSNTSMTAFAFAISEVAPTGTAASGLEPFGNEGELYTYFKYSRLSKEREYGWYTRSFVAKYASGGSFGVVQNGYLTRSGGGAGGVVFGFCI